MAFVSYHKLSKRKRREADRAKRTTWGSIVPVTKMKPSDKIYNRKKARHRQGEPPDAGFFIVQWNSPRGEAVIP